MVKESAGEEAIALRLAQILKDYREPGGEIGKRFTQEEAAEIIGISRQHLQRLERSGGKVARQRYENPTYATLIALADYLDMPLTELVLDLESARAHDRKNSR